MFLLNGTLCSNNFRKVGLIQACVNLSTQILCLAILCKVVTEAYPHKKGYFIHGHQTTKTQETLITHILIDIMFFIAIDIVAYFWLIFGLIKKKQSILTGWLLFSVMELIVVQISTFSFAVYITVKYNSGVGVLGLILPTLVTLYQVYNICVIYTVRYKLMQDSSAPFASRRPSELFSSISYPQYRIPHAPYVSYNHTNSNGSLQTTETLASRKVFPTNPPLYYKESNS